MRLTLHIALLMAIGHPLVCQTPDTTLRKYPTPPKVASDRVEVRYDSQYDKTVLQLIPVALDSTLSMTALVALDGKAVTTPATGVVLTLWSIAPDRPLARDRRIGLTLGTTAFDLGTAWLSPQPRPGYTEVAMKAVPLGLWLALASADTAALRVGTRSFPLSAATLAALRDFASRMAPTGTSR